MATSGNPAKRAAQEKLKVTKANAWKKNETTTDIELPSGNVVKVKRPTIPELLGSGVLPDSIMGKAQAAIDKAKGKEVEADTSLLPEDMVLDEKALIEVLNSFDKIAELVVVEPTVKNHQRKDTTRLDKDVWISIPDSERDEDAVYTDQIDLDDKTFIFNFAVGGTPDLDKFRSEFGNVMGSISAGQSVELATKPDLPD